MSASPGNGLAAKWLPEHDHALRKHLDAKLSFSQAAAKINGEFRTSYSRNAAIGRANRLGWQSSCPNTGGQRKPRVRKGEPTAIGIVERTQRREAQRSRSTRFRPADAEIKFTCEPITGLRIADVVPLHLSLLELEPEQCRWPYGDGSAALPYTFCGCRTFDGSSYCEPHAALARRPTNDAWSDQRREEQSARARRTNMRRAA